MKWSQLRATPNATSQALAVLGDRWTLVILAFCFSDVTRFEDFQRTLGISRTIIADRLKLLTDEGLVERVAYQVTPLRYEYRLTSKGRDLQPLMSAVTAWAETHYPTPASRA